MNIALWVLQILLSLVFLAHGLLFLAPSPGMLALMPFPTAFRLFLGVAEVSASVGLILPGVTRVTPWLVGVTAGALAILMVCAILFHLARGEAGGAAITSVLLVLTSFVAYGRGKLRPIKPRAGA